MYVAVICAVYTRSLKTLAHGKYYDNSIITRSEEVPQIRRRREKKKASYERYVPVNIFMIY